MDSVDYDYHDLMAIKAPSAEARSLHKRICLIVEYAPPAGTPDAYVALAEISLTEARIHALAGDRARACAAMRESDRFTGLAGDRRCRWLGVPIQNDFVPEEFRDSCGRVRRRIEDIVDSTSNTKRYIQTAPGLTKDHRRQITEIYDLASGGVHKGRDGVTLVFDTETAMDYLRSVEKVVRSKPDWRTRGETDVFKPVPSAFQDTLKMRSCRAKVQTATLASGGW
jgi:hypothetical protein